MQKIKVHTSVETLKSDLELSRNAGLTIGFVPTMGALHDGHISLVEQAKQYTDLTVVSIFVNPTQFNNPKDLEKYPRTIDADIAKLEAAGVEFVFIPAVKEIYPENYSSPKIDLGNLANVMEGLYRPGHFDGVVEVVKRLFEIVEPSVACFGQKDFQQLAVIGFMTDYFKFPIEIIGCSIMREESGLAMSSRNVRLTEQEKIDALFIFELLNFAQQNQSNYSPQKLAEICRSKFAASTLELEYLQIVHPVTLLDLQDEWVSGARCCIACYCSEVRLIDNMELL